MNPSEIPLSERVYEAIREIERRKTEARIVPSHALMIRDIFPETGIPPSQILSERVKLYLERRTTGGPTINDRYFKAL